MADPDKENQLRSLVAARNEAYRNMRQAAVDHEEAQVAAYMYYRGNPELEALYLHLELGISIEEAKEALKEKKL